MQTGSLRYDCLRRVGGLSRTDLVKSQDLTSSARFDMGAIRIHGDQGRRVFDYVKGCLGY